MKNVDNILFIILSVLLLILFLYIGKQVNDLHTTTHSELVQPDQVQPEWKGVTPYKVGYICNSSINGYKFLISNSYQSITDRWFYDGYFIGDEGPVGVYHGMRHVFIDFCEKPIDNP